MPPEPLRGYVTRRGTTDVFDSGPPTMNPGSVRIAADPSSTRKVAPAQNTAFPSDPVYTSGRVLMAYEALASLPVSLTCTSIRIWSPNPRLAPDSLSSVALLGAPSWVKSSTLSPSTSNARTALVSCSSSRASSNPPMPVV